MLKYINYDKFDRSTIGLIMGFMISNLTTMRKRAYNERWDDIREDINTIIKACISIKSKVRK